MFRLSNFLLPLVFLLASAKCVAQHNDHRHHGHGPRGTVEVDWELPNIHRVISAGWGFSFGLETYPRKGYPTSSEIDGKRCFTGSYFSFDVDDGFAFDLDEPVTLHFLLRKEGSPIFYVSYDRNVTPMALVEVQAVPIGGGWLEATVVLERARFANGGHGGTDFTAYPKGADAFALKMDSTHTMVIASIELVRSHSTPIFQKKGKVKISSLDGSTGKKTPVRMGIYGANDRSPLPSDDALPIQYVEEQTRQLFLRTAGQRTEFWPSPNRHFFYSDGNYAADLPEGKYRLVVSKGPEYDVFEKNFEIRAGEKTKLEVKIDRWIDMPAQGWYSGDAHIHVERSKKNNAIIQKIMAAEDIHLSNLLQMGNAGGTHFHQYGFGKKGQFSKGNHALASGVEDPRTVHHGHTIGLNIKTPVRFPDEYFLYHKVMKAYQEQGGHTGYAHVDRAWFRDEYGLALDVPFGLVDFLEIMQFGEMGTELWYEFLNLGHKILPVAGSDYPYLDHPGAVRSYVQLEGPFSPAAWFKAFESGKTYVTNGPILGFSVDKQQMGATLDLQKGSTVHIEASVKINPRTDELAYLELVMNGEVVHKTVAMPGEDSIGFTYNLPIEKGSWLAIRAFGKQRAMAHSAATYVHVDKNGHQQRHLLGTIVPKHIRYLKKMKDEPMDEILEIEYWQSGPELPELWKKHRAAMDERIEAAIKWYGGQLR